MLYVKWFIFTIQHNRTNTQEDRHLYPCLTDEETGSQWLKFIMGYGGSASQHHACVTVSLYC